MSKYKVETPVRSYNGLSAGVPFSQGVGYTDSEVAINWFKSKGYTVTELEETKKEETPQEETVVNIPKNVVEDIIENDDDGIEEHEDDEDGEEDVKDSKPANKRTVKRGKK